MLKLNAHGHDCVHLLIHSSCWRSESVLLKAMNTVCFQCLWHAAEDLCWGLHANKKSTQIKTHLIRSVMLFRVIWTLRHTEYMSQPNFSWDESSCRKWNPRSKTSMSTVPVRKEIPHLYKFWHSVSHKVKLQMSDTKQCRLFGTKTHLILKRWRPYSTLLLRRWRELDLYLLIWIHCQRSGIWMNIQHTRTSVWDVQKRRYQLNFHKRFGYREQRAVIWCRALYVLQSLIFDM